MKPVISLLALMLVLLFAARSYSGGAAVSYPDGYRDWRHVKSMLILPGHPLEDPFGGLHHIYANEKAVEGLASGAYPDGAVFVFDLLQYEQADDTMQEGDRKLVGVMERNAKAFAKTGGWGFEGFAGSGKTERLTDDGGDSCYQCHTDVEASSYVFTKPRD